MNIYFAGSIRGGREDKEIYFEIIKLLSKYGQVLTEHVGDKSLSDKGELNISEVDIYNRDIAWVNQSDVIVAEVTTPSVGVGYEIAYAEGKGKKIICLYRDIEGKKKISAMVAGDTNLNIKSYHRLDELVSFFDEVFNS